MVISDNKFTNLRSEEINKIIGFLRFGLKNINLNINISEIIIYFIATVNVLAFAIIISSMFFKVNIQNIINVFNMGLTDCIYITFGSNLISVLITVFIGFPTAFAIFRKKNFLYRIIDIISIIPIVIPPSIAGLALLMTFGRKGLLGQYLSSVGIDLAFNYVSLIIVQVFIMMPIFILIIKNALNSFDKEICESALLEGSSEKDLMFKIYMPLCVRSIMAALILCSLRSIGEFGATIMFAGNVQGKTQTMTTAIYTLYQTNISDALSLAVILVIIFLGFLLLLNFINIFNSNRKKYKNVTGSL